MLTPWRKIRCEDTLIVSWITAYMCHNQLHACYLCVNHLWELCV